MEKHAKSFLFHCLSMTLFQRENACIIGAAAHHRRLEEIYKLGNWNTRNFQKAAFLMRSYPVQSCGWTYLRPTGCKGCIHKKKCSNNLKLLSITISPLFCTNLLQQELYDPNLIPDKQKWKNMPNLSCSKVLV